MNLNEINQRTKEIFTRFDQITDERTKIRKAAAGPDNLIDDSKVRYADLDKLSEEEDKLSYELFGTLKEEAEKQGFIEADGGPYWKIPDDLEELQGVIEHKKMMIEKYPEFEDDRIALKALEMRASELMNIKLYKKMAECINSTELPLPNIEDEEANE